MCVCLYIALFYIYNKAICVCLEVSTATELDKVFSGRRFDYQLRLHRQANVKITSHHITLRMEMELFSETFEFIFQLPRMSAREDFVTKLFHEAQFTD